MSDKNPYPVSRGSLTSHKRFPKLAAETKRAVSSLRERFKVRPRPSLVEAVADGRVGAPYFVGIDHAKGPDYSVEARHV